MARGADGGKSDLSQSSKISTTTKESTACAVKGRNGCITLDLCCDKHYYSKACILSHLLIPDPGYWYVSFVTNTSALTVLQCLRN